jgi:surface antigen
LFVVGLTTLGSPATAANCALWARNETGVDFMGNAGGWWYEAGGRYARGHQPAEGAILVFKPTRHMPSGHVAVVSGLVSSREILIDHANWYRGAVTRRVAAIDTSPGNDWTRVAVIDLGSGKFGRDNPIYGFIYPKIGPHQVAPDIVAASYSSYADDTGLLRFAVDTEDRADGRHWGMRRHASHRHGATARFAHHTWGGRVKRHHA